MFFHCGNWAKDFLRDVRIGTAPILGTMLGEENTVGALEGRTSAGPMSFGRVSTDDHVRQASSLRCDGYFTDDPLNTLGTRSVVRISRLQDLTRCICLNGFEQEALSTCIPDLSEVLRVS